MESEREKETLVMGVSFQRSLSVFLFIPSSKSSSALSPLHLRLLSLTHTLFPRGSATHNSGDRWNATSRGGCSCLDMSTSSPHFLSPSKSLCCHPRRRKPITAGLPVDNTPTRDGHDEVTASIELTASSLVCIPFVVVAPHETDCGPLCEVWAVQSG